MMRFRPFFLLGALLASLSPAWGQPAPDEDLVIISNGEQTGYVRATTQGNRTSVEYLVDNNGRGPRHREEIVVGLRSAPVSYTIEGRSLMGAPVTESYRWENGRATWRSQADNGEVPAAEPPIYIINDGSPYTVSVYARALLADPDNRMAALPTGELRIEKVRDFVLGEGARAVPVTVYRIDGIDTTPDYVMLDAQRRLVSTVGAGSVTIRRGLEDQIPRINALATEFGSDRALRLQQQLAHRFTGPVRIRNVRVFDAAAGTLGAPSTVIVEGERITQVTPGVERGAAPDGQTIIDGEGGTLVPGLHDMHSHLNSGSALYYLAAGVTSIRDMGNDNEDLTRLMARIESGEVAGPRVVRNGFLEARSPFSARNGIIVDSEAAAVDAVRWYADRGFWQIKIYNSMNPAWVPAIAAEAHRRGLNVTGHVPAFTTPDAMIRAGYDEIAHINQLMLGWLIREGEDTRTPLRLTAMARGADLDLNSPTVQATVALMKERNIALDTTAVILERLMLSRAGTVQAGDAYHLDHMPIANQRYRRRSFVTIESPEDDRRYRAGFQRILDTIALLHRNGIRLLPGTDDGTGFTVHRELELYQMAGIPAAEVLSNATLGMERYLGREDRLGTIEPGKLADFFLVPGDPTQNISEVRKVRLVMRGGVVYLPSEIYPALGIRPFETAPTIQAPAPAGERG